MGCDDKNCKFWEADGDYDYSDNPDVPKNSKPVIWCSLCTGAKIAGFQDLTTGKFRGVMPIRDERDLRDFKEMYGLHDVETIM
jgi:hypothetical protein